MTSTTTKNAVPHMSSAAWEKDSMKGSTSRLTDQHAYIPSGPSDSRSPCPALNALANHGYLPRSGTNITLSHLIHTLVKVYNITYILSATLAIVAFLTCGHIQRIPAPPSSSLLTRTWHLLPRWTLSLSALSKRTGFLHIAHDGGLVHPDGRPSTSPDPALLSALLSSPHTNSHGQDGFTLADLARVQARRRQMAAPLDSYHKEIACGECGLLWMAMGIHDDPRRGDVGAVVPIERIRQWMGEERIPEGWTRPVWPIGVLEGRERSLMVRKVEAEEGVV